MHQASLRLDRRSLLLGGAAAAGLVPFAQAQGAGRPLELVATFSEPRQVTGVAVTPDGRVFVNFPRWEEDVAISVAEVRPGGALTPYPNADWNAFRDASPANPGSRFVCVQSVTTDPLGNLWVVDPAAPNLSFEVAGGPKLVRIDPRSNQVAQVYLLDQKVAPQGTYINDIRFTPDGQRAVITNSGQPGSLITLEVGSGALRRVLDGHPSTQFQQGLQVVVDGKPLVRPDGQPPQFSADGLVIDLRGEYVYWQATTGTTMYRAPVAALFNPQIDPASLGNTVQIAARTFIADGYWLSKRGALYLTSCSDNSVKQFLPGGQFATVAQDARLLWPDSMAEGPDGAIYVTASHIPEMLAWQGPGVRQTQLFRFQPG